MKAATLARINRALDREDWEKARHLLLDALKTAPDNHWLLTNIGTTFYEQRRYAEALRWNEKALRLAPECPLVLWDYAGTLDMLGRETEAIEIWQKLIDRGASTLAHGECGEGLRWANSLVNDCRYRVALSSFDLGRRDDAFHYLREHLRHRTPGLPSLYSLREVRAKAKEWETKRAGANGRPAPDSPATVLAGMR